MRHLALIFFVGGALLAKPSMAQVLTDPSDFSGNEAVLTFDPGFATSASPVAYRGVVFSSPTASLTSNTGFGNLHNYPGASDGNALYDDDTSSSDIRIEFSVPVNRVGMLLAGGNSATTWEVFAYGTSGALLGSAIFDFVPSLSFPDAPPVFAGMEFEANIKRIGIVSSDNNGQFTGLDDLRFEAVPEASALSLQVISLGTLACLCVRRRARVVQPRFSRPSAAQNRD